MAVVASSTAISSLDNAARVAFRFRHAGIPTISATMANATMRTAANTVLSIEGSDIARTKAIP
jgi:hypothetical protein